MKHNRKLFILIIPVIAVIIAAVFLFLYPSLSFTDNKPVLERGISYRAEDFIRKARGNVTPENEFLFSNEAGFYSFRYEVKRGPFKRDVYLEYEVKDTRAPLISFKEDTVIKYPRETYTPEQMKENVVLNEGTVKILTDFKEGVPGVYTATVIAEDDYGNTSMKAFKVLVKDTNTPVIFRSGNGTKIRKENDFYIHSVIGYGDDTDPDPKLEIEGEVDTSKTGYYPLYATVTDSSGNSISWSFTVEVVDKIPQNNNDDDIEYYSFEDFKEDHAGEGRKFGLDVSEWQGVIDFEAVRDAGCDFVIMRLGFSHQGKLTLDHYFRRNLEKAKEAGIPVGVYLFCYDNSEEYLRSSVEAMFNELGDTKLELPIFFDWENFRNFQEYGMSFRGLEHLYDVFKEEVEKRGYDCMNYASAYYLNTVWDMKDEDVWMAQYSSKPTYEGRYSFWQLSDRGSIDGIDGRVDFNIMYE